MIWWLQLRNRSIESKKFQSVRSTQSKSKIVNRTRFRMGQQQPTQALGIFELISSKKILRQNQIIIRPEATVMVSKDCNRCKDKDHLRQFLKLPECTRDLQALVKEFEKVREHTTPMRSSPSTATCRLAQTRTWGLHKPQMNRSFTNLTAWLSRLTV